MHKFRGRIVLFWDTQLVVLIEIILLECAKADCQFDTVREASVGEAHASSEALKKAVNPVPLLVHLPFNFQLQPPTPTSNSNFQLQLPTPTSNSNSKLLTYLKISKYTIPSSVFKTLGFISLPLLHLCRQFGHLLINQTNQSINV
jgi:hypothetical protein